MTLRWFRKKPVLVVKGREGEAGTLPRVASTGTRTKESGPSGESVPAVRLAPPPTAPDAPADSDAALRVGEGEERRATTSGPQIFCVLIDSSRSMEEGLKAQEATRVLHEFMSYASRQSGIGDGTGGRSYFLTQVVMFAQKFADLTDGISRPPAALEPPEKWTLRHPDWIAALGNTTDFGQALDHVHEALVGPQGMTPERLEAAMPAPIVLLITDGKPTRPLPEEKARENALAAAQRLKGLVLPAATRVHPLEEMTYPETRVKLITIGLGLDDELDQDFLRRMATTVRLGDEEFPLYLHCPDASQLRLIGAQIVGTMTRADQRSRQRLESVIRHLGSTTRTSGQT